MGYYFSVPCMDNGEEINRAPRIF